MKIIIPAAGFGQRMGRPPAKEILPRHDGRPLIQFVLDLAIRNGLPVHIITREEKQTLLGFLDAYQAQNSISMEIQLIQPSAEWPASVLESENFWDARNLMVLPDTEWTPENIFSTFKEALAHKQVVAGIFKPKESLETWGGISTYTNRLALAEKPQQSLPESSAWGLLGFQKEIGAELFRQLLESNRDHQWKTFPFSYQTIPLEYFSDLTRG